MTFPPARTIDRRRLLGAGALAAAVLALPGCVTTPVRRASLCLPPVRIDPARILKTTVGLRPYRPGGFVVREERIGATRVVHNYGHGGAGITLSWGTSWLATEHGLKEHSGPVAVLGAGIMGLTTARLAQEAGFSVTVYADQLAPDTTSAASGGQWLPTGHYDDDAVSPAWGAQYRAAAAYSHRRFRGMIGAHYGVKAARNYLQTRDATPGPRGDVEALLSGHAVLGPGEHPFPADHVRAFDGMIVSPPILLDRLSQEIAAAGGRIERRRIADRAEIEALPESLVFNCTGLGSAALFGDAELTPIRGQLVWIAAQPGVDYSWSGDGGYMFPRDDAIVLGGTWERGDWSTDPDPATSAGIIAYHRGVFDAFDCRGPV